MSIIEKLGISNGGWKGLHGEGIDKRGNKAVYGRHLKICTVTKCNEDVTNTQLIAAAPEMLEGYIEDILEYETILDIGGFPTPPMTKRCNRNISIIQKATNKSWEEIKELIK